MTFPGPAWAEGGWDRARALVLAHGWNAVAYQILNPGIAHWFDPAGDAVIGYARHGRTRVVAGAPVCAAPRLAAVAATFAADAHRAGERVLYFGAGERLERHYAGRGDHALVALGAQPWWDPGRWAPRVQEHRSLRAQLQRARNKRVRVTEWPASVAAGHPELRAVLARWLAGRGLPPLHFLVEPHTLDCLADRRVFVAARDDEAGGRVVAFLVATPIPARRAWLLEQWPRLREAPNGTVELLVDAAVRALAAAGAEAVTMGLAPLSRRAPVARLPGGRPPPPWLGLALGWARAHGRRFYDFDGLDAFKAKFRPESWEPIYAVAEGSRFPPAALWAVAGVFGGGSPLALARRAGAMAVRAELARLRERLEDGWSRRRSSGTPAA
jgi:phosphatidylglycerol lysyltransferase